MTSATDHVAKLSSDEELQARNDLIEVARILYALALHGESLALEQDAITETPASRAA